VEIPEFRFRLQQGGDFDDALMGLVLIAPERATGLGQEADGGLQAQGRVARLDWSRFRGIGSCLIRHFHDRLRFAACRLRSGFP
jgi:hypothetical protein